MIRKLMDWNQCYKPHSVREAESQPDMVAARTDGPKTPRSSSKSLSSTATCHDGMSRSLMHLSLGRKQNVDDSDHVRQSKIQFTATANRPFNAFYGFTAYFKILLFYTGNPYLSHFRACMGLDTTQGSGSTSYMCLDTTIMSGTARFH
ncbi:hypothetical protein C8J56DRAFT_1026456 [Mycena floridula]|nr:hypothetical protein C8J56DRAFT_1026456 [Mycena floridula]